MVSFLSVRISEIKRTKEFDSKQRTFDQTNAKVVLLTMKTKNLCQIRSFIGRQGLSRNLLPSHPR